MSENLAPNQNPRRDVVAHAGPEEVAQARRLLGLAHGALAWTDPEAQTPGISRIAFGLDPAGVPMTLISGLAPHMAALRAHPICAVLLGEVGERGDPLTHPRLMLRAHAEFIERGDEARPILRAHWLKGHPKATLYVDFPDFAFVRLHPISALLNGGFGQAYQLSAQDLIAA